MYWNPNNPYLPLGTPQGWVCPKCGRVYSPMTPSCFHCGSGNYVTTDKTTPLPTANDSEWWDKYFKQSTTGNPANVDKTQITCSTAFEDKKLTSNPTPNSDECSVKQNPNLNVTITAKSVIDGKKFYNSPNDTITGTATVCIDDCNKCKKKDTSCSGSTYTCNTVPEVHYDFIDEDILDTLIKHFRD